MAPVARRLHVTVETMMRNICALNTGFARLHASNEANEKTQALILQKLVDLEKSRSGTRCSLC